MNTCKKGADRNLDMLDVMSGLAKKLRISGRYLHGARKLYLLTIYSPVKRQGSLSK
jgi:hypothetical protein